MKTTTDVRHESRRVAAPRISCRARLHPLAAGLIGLLLVLSLQGSTGSVRLARAGDIRAPIDTRLTYSGEPGLGRTVTLTVETTPLVQADELILRWVLPPGAQISAQTAEPLGSAAAGQTITRQVDVAFQRAGAYKVAADIQMTSPGLSGVIHSAGVLFFTIVEGAGSTVSAEPPRLKSLSELVDTPEARYVASAEPQSPDGGYWVRGRFLYDDLPITGGNQFVGSYVQVPARQVKVEIWEQDPLFDDHDGTTRTDDDGYFAFWVPDNNDGWLGGDKETYLKIFANTPGGYVTDISWIDGEYKCTTDIKSGGHDIDYGTFSPASHDPMFHIADVLLTARDYAGQFRDPPRQVQARYEPGYGEDKSFFNWFFDEITLADHSDDPDPYDDTVILHEYGHFIADAYACDESEGGEHDAFRSYSKKLAWSEGWASYFSSAVRNTSRYYDVNGTGYVSEFNWEDWSWSTGSRNEGAVCATLWDLYDGANETHDRLALGMDEIWNTFDNRMHGSDRCTVIEFWEEWIAAGYPDDSELAAIFDQYGTAGKETQSALAPPPAPQPAAAAGLPMLNDAAPQAAIDPEDSGEVPWQGVFFLVDRTNSMAVEISAVKQIIQDNVSAMDALSEAHQYRVETLQDIGYNEFVADGFFPDQVNPLVAGITVGGGDDAPEDTFAALARGTHDKYGYDAWLFTDAAPRYLVSGSQMEGILQERDVTPFFFIMGDCSEANLLSVEEATESAPRIEAPGRLALPRFSPAGLEECIEPYLLVAAATGGQLLPIDASQMGDAAEIVRAFMSNNAGAGRWANYVSSSFVYSWDDTAYNWYNASGGAADYMFDCRAVTMPKDFSFYGTSYSSLNYCASGYITFGTATNVTANTAIPNASLPNQAIYAFWDSLYLPEPPALATNGSTIDSESGVYTAYDAANDHYVIEYHDARHSGTSTEETFEILLDYATGEIILQYNTVGDDSSCTVGVENSTGTGATQVIYNNPGSLYSGRAIKLTPIPAAPTRDHPVLVDSTMEGVLFLLNGYSGSVNLTVLDPTGAPLSPADPNVTYLNVGRLKYYRVSNPQPGTWIGRASGDGTYYFTSAAASPLAAEYHGDQTLPVGVSSNLAVDLGMPVASASFSLVNSAGQSQASLSLFDDGAHGDGQAGDGLYGGAYTPAKSGAFYVQASGLLLPTGALQAGESFSRTDASPIRFQPMLLSASSPQRYAKPGDTVNYTLWIFNGTSVAQLVSISLQAMYGWSTAPELVAVQAMSTKSFQVSVTVPAGAGPVTDLTAVTAQAAGLGDTVTLATTVRGPATQIDLAAYPERIPVNGGQALIVALVGDEDGYAVADGTQVTLGSTLGSLSTLSATTVDGQVTATLTSGATTGIAQVQATAGGVAVQVPVEIGVSPAYTLTLSASQDRLPADGSSTALLTAQVVDKFGQPAPDGSQIVFGVNGDDLLLGSIAGQEVYTATTSGGAATATYRAGTASGVSTIRAGVVFDDEEVESEGTSAVRWAQTSITLSNSVYLPVILRASP